MSKGRSRWTTKWCRNPGVPQGFIKFGSVYHKILVHIFTNGQGTHRSIVEDDGLDSDTVGMALSRLLKHGFIYVLRWSEHDPITGKKAWVYVINRPRGGAKLDGPISVRDRTRKYKALKKLRVNNVFAFRGKIEVQNVDIQHD